MNPFDSGPRPKPPTISPPARMPDPTDPGIIDAKRRAITDTLGRGGRQSTILTGQRGGANATYDTFAGKALG